MASELNSPNLSIFFIDHLLQWRSTTLLTTSTRRFGKKFSTETCLRVVPGSHKGKLFKAFLEHIKSRYDFGSLLNAGFFELAPDYFTPSSIFPVLCPAGSLVLWQCGLTHDPMRWWRKPSLRTSEASAVRLLRTSKSQQKGRRQTETILGGGILILRRDLQPHTGRLIFSQWRTNMIAPVGAAKGFSDTATLHGSLNVSSKKFLPLPRLFHFNSWLFSMFYIYIYIATDICTTSFTLLMILNTSMFKFRGIIKRKWNTIFSCPGH